MRWADRQTRASFAPVVVAGMLLVTGCTQATDSGAAESPSSPAASASEAPAVDASPAPAALPSEAGTPSAAELAAPAGMVPDGWEQHTTADGRVGFALPAGAERSSTPNPEAPDVLIDSFVVVQEGDEEDGETVLSVLWQPWPEGRGAPRDGTVELALQDFRDGFTSSSGLDPATVQQRRLQVQERPGLEVTGTNATDGTTVSARYLLLERGGVGLVVLGADEGSVDAAAETLFETLRLP